MCTFRSRLGRTKRCRYSVRPRRSHVVFVRCELNFFLLFSRSREIRRGVSKKWRVTVRKKNPLHFPVKLIRFFVRSISRHRRRRASPGTTEYSCCCCCGALFSRHSRGLPVINFTSLKSRDFQGTEYGAYYLFST